MEITPAAAYLTLREDTSLQLLKIKLCKTKPEVVSYSRVGMYMYSHMCSLQ